MDPTAKAAELDRKAELHKKESFAKWMDEPMVRMGLSMIPKGDHEDALKMVLQSAFQAGFAAGSGHMLSSMVESLLKKKPSNFEGRD